MSGFMPGIQVLLFLYGRKTWMAGTSPAMTMIVAWPQPEKGGAAFT
jgi:hypothetical protein